jgi:phosphoglycerate dehydrogenase-like enzyme
MGIAEDLVAKLQAISPRLNIEVEKANRIEDISSDAWTTAEVLYTGRIIPGPDQAPNLRWIQFHFAGIDHARDSAILKRENLVATTLSGASATQVAEYTVMMLLALGHRLPDMLEHQRKSTWPKDRWERFSPFEMRGRTVGIIGYGSIGRQVARILHSLGAQVLATKRDLKHPEDSDYVIPGFGDPGGDYVHRLYPAEALKSVARASDFLVVTVPLTVGTRDLINSEVFEVMKESAFLVDTSRGGVVNQTALINALHDHKISGVALDVFPEEPLPQDNPLWKMPNVIISPHISGNTPFYDERAMELFAENLRRYLAGDRLLNPIDLSRGY